MNTKFLCCGAMALGIALAPFSEITAPSTTDTTQAATAKTTSPTITTTAALDKQIRKKLLNMESNFTLTYKGNIPDGVAYVKTMQIQQYLNDANLHALLHKYTVNYSYTDTKLTIKFDATYFTTKAKQAKAEKKIKSVVASIKKKHKTKSARLKAINSYIVKNTAYDLNAKNRHSAYGVLFDKRAVCQGYAYTAYLMMKELGYNAKYVTGMANGDTHAWTMVKVGKYWYHFDPTFNDPTPDVPGNVSYAYLLVSDTELAKTHTWNRTETPKASKNFFK